MIIESMGKDEKLHLNKSTSSLIIGHLGDNVQITSRSCVKALHIPYYIGSNVRITLGPDSAIYIDKGVEIGSGLVIVIPGQAAAVICDAKLPSDASVIPLPVLSQ